MTDQDVYELLKKYIDGQCTPDEKRWLYTWYDQLDQNSAYHDDEAVIELINYKDCCDATFPFW